MLKTLICIGGDYTKHVQEERKVLKPTVKEAREKRLRANIGYDKLIVNDEIYEVKRNYA